MPSFRRSHKRKLYYGFLLTVIVHISVVLYYFLAVSEKEDLPRELGKGLKNKRLLMPKETKNAHTPYIGVRQNVELPSQITPAVTSHSQMTSTTISKTRILNASITTKQKPSKLHSNSQNTKPKRESQSTKNTDTDTLPIILWWNSPSNAKDYDIQCGKLRCRNSNNKKNLNNSNVQAFVFYGSSFEPHDLPSPRLKNHLWGLYHEESPKNARFLFNTEEALSLFNYTATFKQESDFPLFSHYLKDPDDLHRREFFIPTRIKDRIKQNESLAPIAYVQSDCGTHSDRDTIVKMLQRYVRIDSYGTCLHNKDMPDELTFKGSMRPLQSDKFMKFMARYKFTLAIENYVCRDYVTEKFWRSLEVGSVPIVFGAPNIKDYLPNNKSAIVIEDFKDIPSLVKYILFLDSNASEYEKYMKHKNGIMENAKLAAKLKYRGWSSKSNAPIQSDYDAFTCFMCEKVHEQRQRKTDQEKHIAKLDHFGCPKPKRFDENGKYTVDNERWAYDWNNAKYIAKAMLHFSHLHKRVNASELYEYAAKLQPKVTATG